MPEEDQQKFREQNKLNSQYVSRTITTGTRTNNIANDKKISYKDLKVKRVFPLQKKLFLCPMQFWNFWILEILEIWQ